MKKLGAETAMITSVEPVEVDGAPFCDVTVTWDSDARVDTNRLRADLVPDGLKAGDRVEITRAALYGRWTIAPAAASA